MNLFNLLFLGLFVFVSMACGGEKSTDNSNSEPKSMVKKEAAKEVDPMKSLGVGPITTPVTLGDLDKDLAMKGKKLYEAKCTACHKADKKYIGPAPKGILERRNPAWVMNMILDPERMIKEDPTAKKLLMEFNGTPMANQSLTKEEARAILEYFRTL